MITHDYISTVQFFNSVVIVVIIYIVIQIYTKMFRLNLLPITLYPYSLPLPFALYPLPLPLTPNPLNATRVLETPLENMVFVTCKYYNITIT